MTEKQLTEFFVEQHVLQPSQAEDVLNEVELNGQNRRAGDDGWWFYR